MSAYDRANLFVFLSPASSALSAVSYSAVLRKFYLVNPVGLTQVHNNFTAAGAESAEFSG